MLCASFDFPSPPPDQRHDLFSKWKRLGADFHWRTSPAPRWGGCL